MASAPQLKDSARPDVGRARGAVTKTSRQASPEWQPPRQGTCMSGDGGRGWMQWRHCDSSGLLAHSRSSEVFTNTALQQHGVDMSCAFDDDCINALKILQRWANCLGLGVHRIWREQCACGRNARRVYTERVSERLANCCSSNATRASRLIFEGSYVSRSPVGFEPCVTAPRGVPAARAVPRNHWACTETTLSRATNFSKIRVSGAHCDSRL